MADLFHTWDRAVLYAAVTHPCGAGVYQGVSAFDAAFGRDFDRGIPGAGLRNYIWVFDGSAHGSV